MQRKTKSRVKVKCPKCSEIFLPSLKEKQSRAGKSSRKKGANFERTLAKKFQLWWNENDKFNYEFRRTPQSGGSILKEGWDLAGDISSNAPEWPFHIEAKNAPGSYTGLHNFFSKKSALWKWWEQANSDCPNHRIPLLIINRFDLPTVCITDGSLSLKRGTYISEIIQCELNLDHFIFNNFFSIWKLDDMLASDPKLWSNEPWLRISNR